MTGGNVSFYNESPSGAVLPTPVVADMGVRPGRGARGCPPRFSPARGDVIVCLGVPRGELGGSQYLSLVAGDVFGAPPRVDLAAARALVDCLVACAGPALLSSAHDVSEGGLAVALAECCALAPELLGADVDVTALGEGLSAAAVLFGEDQGVVVVSVRPDRVAALEDVARRHGVAARVVGAVGEPEGDLRIRAGGERIVRPVARLRRIYEDALPRRLNGVGGTQLARSG